MKLPSYSLKARQEAPSSNNGNGCDCLSGGAIAGIVIGSIAGFFLLYWLLKLAFDSTNTSETVTYRTGRYDHPSRHRRRSSSYVETERPVSTRRYRRDVIERPAKVYHCFDMRRIRSLTQHTQRRLHVDIAAQMGLQPPKPRLSSAKRQQYTSLFSVSLEPCWPACLAIAASNLNVRPLATIKTFWSATADPRPVVPG
ncbi:hypothetical protein CIHG_00834 [Coccidioides immitis H538.4]|uniref:Uncharacterized protein n=2 Tax=Coccidioides immitis TaxID=5501 RepID=A0A0J8RDP3_COCIT|nr:hypothetical protein CIRG_03252 [Coccidioides immitis RMSCC 2394]KMU83052.1 hypothetical protein CIHG_00834 [Coccidioides immitis H538.4]